MLTKNIEYVAGFLFDDYQNRVVLIEKQNPEWQKGLYNAVGGKIEPGEIPIKAMRREFYEETGFAFRLWKHYITLQGRKDNRWKVHFFYAFDSATVGKIHSVDYQQKTSEKVSVYYLHQLQFIKTIPNLNWLIPMALSMSQESASRFLVKEVN